MTCAEPDAIPGFDQYRFPDTTTGKTVYWSGERGRPAVILLHELPGMAQECIELGRGLTHPMEGDDGYQVHMPLLFGTPGPKGGLGDMARWTWCIRREFGLFTRDGRSPITEWVSALAREAAERSGSAQVAIIGMCLTGSLVIGLVADVSVAAVVASQPSMPLAVTPGRSRDLSVPFETVRDAAGTGAPLLAMRYKGDVLCRRARLERLAEAYGMDLPEVHPDQTLDVSTRGLRVIEVPGARHALLTFDPSSYAMAAVREFLRVNLSPSD